MDTNGALSTIGLLVCVGAVVVVALLAFAFRALAGGRRQQQQGDMWNRRGTEQPRYDNPDIESRGGFGGVPNTGMDLDRDTDINRGGTGTVGSAGFGGAQTYDQDRDRPRRKDDDDVRSSGGFGNG